MSKRLADSRVEGDPAAGRIQLAAVSTCDVTEREDRETDAVLLSRMAVGDSDAFTVMISRYYRPLFSMAIRYLHNTQDAEDAAQDALLRIWQKAALWKQAEFQPRSWIYRVAYNLIIDEVRKQKLIQNSVASQLQDEQLGTVVDSLEQTRMPDYLDQAMRDLPERQRTAIALCAMQGLSNIEAAEVLDISIEALESLLARGRRQLRTALQQRGVDI